jgi:hypothetical protein
LKNFGQTFELLDNILNYLDFNSTYANYKQIFYNLFTTYNSYKENNKKLLRDLSRGLVVFIAKFLIKTNSGVLLDVLGENAFVYLLNELCDYLTDLDNNKNKKLVTYAYCLIMNDYYSKFNIDQLKFFTAKLISHLEKFNKITDVNYENMLTIEISYNSNTYNKLQNADIKVD